MNVIKDDEIMLESTQPVEEVMQKLADSKYDEAFWKKFLDGFEESDYWMAERGSQPKLKDKYLSQWLTPEIAQLQLKAKKHLREPVVRFEQFVLDEEYLWLDWDVYEMILVIGWCIMRNPKLREVVILAWIGSWKSFLSNLLTAYDTYTILCLKDPHDYYRLSKDKPITIMNMGLSAGQAKKVVFAWLKSMITQSKWFRRQFINPQDEILNTRIIFKRPIWLTPRGKIIARDVLALESGNSAETTPIGMNLFSMTLDEAAFYIDTDGRNQAEDIYFAAQSRIKSRFGSDHGRVIIISSPRYEKDFITEKYHEGQKFPDVMFSIALPTWRVKDRKKLKNEVFVFDCINYVIYSEEQWKTHELWWEISPYQREKLKFNDEVLDKSYRIIPLDFHDSFNRSPEKSMRDLWARPTDTIEAFFKIRTDIDKAMSYWWKNRVDDMWVRDTDNPPNEPVYIHIDIWMNKNWKWDCAWISVCRCIWYDKDNDYKPIVVYDFIEQVKAWSKKEIQIEDLRAKVLSLAYAWWNIGRVTLDSFQSFDTVQILNSKGIRTENLSVDVTPQPYESLREWFRAWTVYLPEHAVLKTELRELEWVKWAKVDHPPKWSKDVSDSVAGSYYSCITDLWDAYIWHVKSSVRIKR